MTPRATCNGRENNGDSIHPLKASKGPGFQGKLFLLCRCCFTGSASILGFSSGRLRSAFDSLRGIMPLNVSSAIEYVPKGSRQCGILSLLRNSNAPPLSTSLRALNIVSAEWTAGLSESRRVVLKGEGLKGMSIVLQACGQKVSCTDCCVLMW